MHLMLEEASPQSGHCTYSFATGLLHPPLWGKQDPLPPRLPTPRQAPGTPPSPPSKARRWTPTGAGPRKGAGSRLAPPLQYPEAASARRGVDRPALRGAGSGALTRQLPRPPPAERPPGSRRRHAEEPAELAGRLPPDVR